ncbi:MAG: 1-acyl-sn-glycerol-3-phosphate acyltransferase [Desulfuromonas sp.]|nr:MAG: 1-acyl-sn-glycerol-3-phosphate acyltransferase [Desulfuromonas sp.]
MLRTIIFFGTYIPFTGLCILLAIMVSLCSTANRVHQVARWWGKVALWLGGVRIETTGSEHIEAHRPTIYMANHQSNFDIPILYSGLPIQFRWLAKKELFDVPFFGNAMQRAGYIPVDRGNRKRAIASMDYAADRIRQGASVIIFPEGTRSPDGNLLSFKKGGFMLALQSGAPIVPIAISGSRDLMPKNQLRIRGGTVNLTIFPAIDTTGLTENDRDHLIATVVSSISSAVTVSQEPVDA